ncbi:sugar kinase [Xylophilus sp. GOD-11R]|uniref:sugar kinase n=1 Tax=Xylophilus sp. GOD-11R TaxID=3089814 RepID=UPI00298C0277|nr:sugar kinase [Xylophilus sp. GOD-11R]WPB58915.1 sugar kinase [Xylophilus sp. GOD-11R]
MSQASQAARRPGCIVSIGEAMIEFNQARPGEPQYVQGFGGDTANCLVAAARQGVQTRYISAIGDDTFGAMLIDLWKREGVDTSQVLVDPQAPTGVYFVTHGQAGHQFGYLRAGSAASRIGPGSVTPAALDGAAFLHVSGITQAISTSACDASFVAMNLARERGVPVAYDPNLRLRLWPLERARAVIRESVGLSDILLVSSDDASVLTGEQTPDAMRDVLLAWGARTVVLKLGALGATVHAAGADHHFAGHAVDCVDATGAGDCFAGALLARLASGDDIVAASRYANAAAALSTRGFGAIAPIPKACEVVDFLNRTEAAA